MTLYSVWLRVLLSVFVCVSYVNCKFTPALAQSIPVKEGTCETSLSKATLKKTDGLLPIYKIEGSAGLILGLRKEGLDEEYIFSTYIEEAVSPFVGDYVQSSIIRFEKSARTLDIFQTFSNITYAKGSPLEKTQKTSLSDSRLSSLPLLKCTDDDYYYAAINEASLKALTEPAIGLLIRQIGRVPSYNLDARTKSINAYKDNINFSVDLFLNTSRNISGAANNSNFKIKVVHSIIKLPDDDFQLRAVDPSIGYFSVDRIDLTKLNRLHSDSYIQRWRLDKKDPTLAVSDPVEPIVFWIENTTPYGFREPIKKGVLAWNEAFKEAGFSNAIEVRVQPDDAKWDAGDINYNVIRWEATPFSNFRLGYGPSAIDPRTGEVLGADILLNFTGLADRFGHWLALSDYEWLDKAPSENAIIAGRAQKDTLKNSKENFNSDKAAVLAQNEKFSLSDYAYASSIDKISSLRRDIKPKQAQFSGVLKLHELLIRSKQFDQNKSSLNEKIEPLFPPVTFENLLVKSSTEAADDDPTVQLARMIREVITNITMHEIGHTLGLTHNFAGSRYRSFDDIHDPAKTNGILSASVMDYAPINFAPPSKTQGDYASTRVGPYDSWAIKFGYDPDLREDTNQRTALLQKAGTRGYQYGLLYSDPYTIVYDLTDDPVAYAQDSLELASSLITISDAWSVRENSDVNVRIYSAILGIQLQAYSIMASQLTPVNLSVDSTFERPERNRIILSYTKTKDQIKALEAIKKHVFSARSWKQPAALAKRMGAFSSSSIIQDGGQVLFTDSILEELLSIQILASMQNAKEQGGEGITVEQYLSKIRTMILGDDLGPTGNPSKQRQAQQYLYLSKLSSLYYQGKYGYSGSPILELSLLPLNKAIQKEIDAVNRALLFSYFWLPTEVKNHRQTLRELMP